MCFDLMCFDLTRFQGVAASGEDLLEAFGTEDHEKACLEILRAGDLQVRTLRCARRAGVVVVVVVVMWWRCWGVKCLPRRPRRRAQVSEGERAVALSNMFKDVATIVTEKCVNPTTQRPYVRGRGLCARVRRFAAAVARRYTLSMIERAMHEAHVALVASRSAKQQVRVWGI